MTKLYPRFIASTLGPEHGGIEVRYYQGLENKTRFREDLLGGFYSGGASVVVDLIQLAQYMGFDNIYLVGIDFSFYIPKGSETEETSISGDVLKSSGEVNHFHKDYRKPGEKWTVPRLDDLKDAFAICGKFLNQDRERLVNASRVSKLDVLPRADFDKTFDS
jgi:hypothetical protein